MYLDRGFLEVSREVFIRGEVFTFYPCGFYSGRGFTKITHDVLIPLMCTIWHPRVNIKYPGISLETRVWNIDAMFLCEI